MNYCLVIVTIFNKGENECTIRARGRSISKAVDVAEITTRRFLPEIVEIDKVNIGSEELEGEHGTKTVSTIDIVLTRKSAK
jgi:DNA-binding protein